ncbi:hypothetical protein GSH06_20350 [Burkholderia pseudomallei]|nr:hypothetical protein [Burkholderia pseudomallei]
MRRAVNVPGAGHPARARGRLDREEGPWRSCSKDVRLPLEISVFHTILSVAQAVAVHALRVSICVSAGLARGRTNWSA